MSAMQYRQHVFTELLTNLQVTGWSAVKAPLVSCAGVQERGEARVLRAGGRGRQGDHPLPRMGLESRICSVH